jgi:hypothetical protein
MNYREIVDALDERAEEAFEEIAGAAALADESAMELRRIYEMQGVEAHILASLGKEHEAAVDLLSAISAHDENLNRLVLVAADDGGAA